MLAGRILYLFQTFIILAEKCGANIKKFFESIVRYQDSILLQKILPLLYITALVEFSITHRTLRFHLFWKFFLSIIRISVFKFSNVYFISNFVDTVFDAKIWHGNKGIFPFYREILKWQNCYWHRRPSTMYRTVLFLNPDLHWTGTERRSYVY